MTALPRLHAWSLASVPFKKRKDARDTFVRWSCAGCGRWVIKRHDLKPEDGICTPQVHDTHQHAWRDIGMTIATHGGRQVEVWEFSCVTCWEGRTLVLEKGQMQRLQALARERARQRLALIAEAVAA